MSLTKVVTEEYRKNIGTKDEPKYVTGIRQKRVEITEDEARESHSSWEFYRGSEGEPLGRRVADDGTVLEEDVPQPEELVASEETEKERQRRIDAIHLPNAVDSVGQKASIKQEVLDILVKVGAVGPDEAEAMGWTPPAV